MRYFLGFFATILLIILLVVLLFRGGGKPKVPQTSKTLDSYSSTNSEVSLTIDGPINAESEHEQVRITVDRNNSTYEHLKGYDGNVVQQQRYPNTETAYEDFLLALSHIGFTQGDKQAPKDERGYCPRGTRYIYELKDNDKNIQRLWSSTCTKPRSYLGDAAVTNELFKAQIPNYHDLVRGVDIST